MLALAVHSGCHTVPVQVSPQAPELRFGGRVDRGDAQGARLAWGGTSLTVRFTGTSLGLRLLDLPKVEERAPNRFRFSVDGAPFRDLYVGEGRMLYRVVEGLPEGEHVLRLEKETESSVGETQFLGLELDPGAQLLPAPPAPTRRIEFIGDSGLTGFGIEGKNEQCSFNVETQRSSLTWPALTARALGAEATIIAFSGKGVAVNHANDPSPPLPQLYERPLPYREDSRWNFNSWVPDAVVIQLGANDFWKEHPGEERFRNAYRALVDGIRGHYPNAHIVCLLGSGISDSYPKDLNARSNARVLISGVVESLRQSGDSRVHFAEVPPKLEDEGFGCVWHPSRKTHQRTAEQMTPLLHGLLGWR
ncbi:SGNH/GDSL hydrolase family protein [Archangium lansingense]|uniref:SGNH/GDSL hydrolase family protein n=1 Tax=Archangium lansingense TaxID=2995310 RepID=A0ABT4A136_9BACT|nr:SGNH/GDSL hydrolase family protein [Archangium lansinium]MCY1075347.1 SGNH/GDSL hydrolase family protein [Archangium lansinium]